MNFDEWQSYSSAAAARELVRRAGRLSAEQRRAVIGSLPDEAELERRFAATAPDAPLRGVPCLLKDLFDCGGEPTWAGSTFLPEVRPPRPAGEDGAFCRALRAAGAMVAGKAQCVEFAYGLTGENAHYGDCTHPRFPDRTTGGSSSGSAAAVAAGVVPLATASDTGGSVRAPAAFCGLFGVRFAPGQDWIADGVPLARSFDTAGWFTASPGDMERTLEALVRGPVRAPLAGSGRSRGDARGCYLAMPGVDAAVAEACAKAAETLAPKADRDCEAELMAAFALAEPAYQVITSAEAWEVHRPWYDRYQDRYGPATRARIERGIGLGEEQVEAARRDLARVRQTWRDFFRAYDFLAMPSVPCAAMTRAEFTPENRRRILRLMAPASLGGCPALALPVALDAKSPALTAGLQVVVPEAPAASWRRALRQWPLR